MDEEDRKPPARPPPRSNDELLHHKRRKDNIGGAIVGESGGGDIYDVADQLNFRPGDRFEVKWTILGHDLDDDAERGGGGGSEDAKDHEGSHLASPPIVDDGRDDYSDAGGVTVWWEATLVKKTDRLHDLTHDLTDEERRGEGITTTTSVRVPIYELNYSPWKYGFDSHSVEDVAFVSDTTLLNLSTDEVMKFRRAGMPSPPSSPEVEAVEEELDGIAREFIGQDDMMNFMNRMMQRVMKKTGMDQMMKGMPASQQLIMAERIRKAKEGMLDMIMEETSKMGTGEDHYRRDRA
ncbi:hypothetical protein ACHAXA_002466 [Cyclostephanos tholiformis]|uniref:Uncharacterized protein n=1 Tax=Cyclostephanos tholiformis TaxID=382380 RepID=A0ABD3R080_9STRA